MRFYILNSFRDIQCQNVLETFGTPCISSAEFDCFLLALLVLLGIVMQVLFFKCLKINH